MNKNRIFFVLSFCILLLHVLTLNISPVPWFDEVFFLSISESFKEEGVFRLAMAPYYDKEILTYGPIYFVLTALSTEVFGLGVFQFRIVNFLFSLLAVFAFKKILSTNFNLSKTSAFGLSLALFLEPIFHANSHGGRMDMVALFFVLMSIHHYLKSHYNKEIRYSILLSGVFASLALLTTPRLAVFIFAIPLMLLIELIRSKLNIRILKKALLWGIIILFVYSIWVFVAFGGINEMLDYYSNLTQFVGGKWLLPTEFLPTMGLSFLSLVLILIFSRKNLKIFFLDAKLFIPVASIITFHTLVSVTSKQYFCLVLPFYLLIIASFAEKQIHFTAFKKKFQSGDLLIKTLLCYYGFIFIIKMSVIFIAYDQRSSGEIDEFFEKNIEQGKTVVANYQYAYSILKNNNKYITPNYSLEISQDSIKNYLIENIEMDYLMVATSSAHNPLIKEYIEEVGMEKIGEFKTIENQLIKRIETVLPIQFNINYDGSLYKKL